jgi:DNA repair protein RecN (Recombination protein N)
MLKHLNIQNYVLIDKLEIDFSNAFNVITGETGAGKSILLGAIGMLEGKRADTKALADSDKNCIVEGTFDVSKHAHLKAVFEDAEIEFEDICQIRRLINPSGKSRVFINDAPVTLDVLKKISEHLLDIHSQHDTLLLASTDYQLLLCDLYGELEELKNQYFTYFQEWKKAESKKKKMLHEIERMKKEYDYNHFVWKELADAGLDNIEQEKLEKKLEKIDNIELIKKQFFAASALLSGENGGAETQIREALQFFNKTSQYDKTYGELAERLQSVFLELKDICRETENISENLFTDEEEAENVRSQLNKLNVLLKKYQSFDVSELIRLREEYAQKVQKIDDFDSEINQIEQQIAENLKKMCQVAPVLTQKRQETAEKLCQKVNSLLAELAMPNAQLLPQVSETDFSPTGKDKIAFLFSANKGISPKSLKDAASGGEFSRLMLCFKYVLAEKIALPTIIFDEIDTGISGEVAMKVGNLLAKMSEKHQMLVISHLPQIAAKGDAHFFVFKDHSGERTFSQMRLLTHKERVREIAQMIGGANPSQEILQSAEQLLNADVF